ncbi:hypothetical protein KKH13_05210 [Patescibacteria group bacterium]|nr:hypothetical protein [Patescibacteria group bacterium]
MNFKGRKMIDKIFLLLFRAGLRCDKPSLLKIYDYTLSMLRDKRLAMFFHDEELIGIAYFSICNSIDNYQNKPCWQYISHDPLGHIAFIEKVVALKWNKQLRILLEHEITSRYGNVKLGVAYRSSLAEDRQRTYKLHHGGLRYV